MQNRHAIIYPLFLALMLAIITFWLSQTVEEQGSRIDGRNRHDPDYMMYSFVTTQTDKTGVIRYVLNAAELIHYPDNDATALKKPQFTQYAANRPYTKIQGNEGNVSSDGEMIEMHDNVIVTRQAWEDRGEMQLLTDKLIIQPNKDIATTDYPVTIRQMPNTLITGKGMIFNKKHQTMQLLHQVKVHYERPAPKPSANNITPKKAASNPVKKRVVKRK